VREMKLKIYFNAILQLGMFLAQQNIGLCLEGNGQVIVVAAATIPGSLDPTEAWYQAHYLAIGCFLATLVRISKSGAPEGLIARKWEISLNGKQIDFTINSDAKFHDGTQITSADIAYSISRHFWPSRQSAIREILRGVIVGTNEIKEGQLLSGLEIVSPSKFSIKLEGPYPPLLSVLASPGFGILKKGTGESGKIIGSGPMTANYNSNSHSWTLLRNELFFGPPAKVKKIILREVKDEKLLVTLFANHEVDLTLGYSSANLMDSHLPKWYSNNPLDSLAVLHLFANAEHLPVSNFNVRKKISDVIMYSISRTKNDGYGIHELQSYLPTGIMPVGYYTRQARNVRPEKAKGELAKLFSGRKIQIILRKEYLSDELVRNITFDLKRAGIRANVIRQSISEVFSRIKHRQYDYIMMAYMGMIPDPDGFLEPLNQRSSMRLGVIPSQKLFEQINQTKFIQDPAQRLGRYTELLRNFETQAYIVPLFRLDYPVIKEKNIFIPDTNYRWGFELYNIEHSDGGFAR
jgi:ABC-type transport system substrate-binding protein